MSSVTFPTAIGGDGSTVTDDDNATTGLRNGGWRTRFIPCFTNLVNIADYMVSYTAQTSTFAEPPPMGSTTPNTGAFTRVTVTGSTAPANGLYLPAANALGFATNSTERVRIDSSGNVGIGTSSPAQTLHVKTATGGTPITLGVLSNATGLPALSFNGAYASTTMAGIYGNGASASNLYYTVPAGQNHFFAVADSAKMTLDSSGNLGLGVTPSAWASGIKAFQVGANSYGSAVDLNNGATAWGSNYYNDGGNKFSNASSRWALQYLQDSTNGNHSWRVSGAAGTAGNAISFTQAMTLDASGFLLVGTTSSSGTSGTGHKLDPNGRFSVVAPSTTSDNFNYYNSTASAFRFYVTNAGVINATSTTITAISDQRLKENIRDLDDGLAAILSLKPRKFDWKEGKGKDIKDDRGFIAQEFEQVFPDLIDTWKDPAPEGEEPYKAVRPDLIPVMVKAIQEIAARLEALEAK